MSEQELLPCPFCGGEAEITRYGDNRKSTIVECTECGCRLENGEAFRHGTAWNTRPAPTVAQAAKVLLASEAAMGLGHDAIIVADDDDNPQGKPDYDELLKAALRAIAGGSHE
jgi:predicted RNA-binding Zn-ribbon protein involved in translation (DUF1610 family)